MSKTTKQPKETDEIRELLEAYGTFQRRIDNTEERLAFIRTTKGSPSSTNYSGMPSGSRDGTSKQERNAIKEEELVEKLRNMYAEENRKREEIEELIERMEKPDEEIVIEMRYLDFASWRAISAAAYGNEEDYEEHEQRYLKKIFKIHGSALQTLARIYTQKG